MSASYGGIGNCHDWQVTARNWLFAPKSAIFAAQSSPQIRSAERLAWPASRFAAHLSYMPYMSYMSYIGPETPRRRRGRAAGA